MAAYVWPTQVLMFNRVCCFHGTADVMDAMFGLQYLCANAFAVYAFDHARKCNKVVPKAVL